MSKPTVLVIDDERDIRELLTITLGRMGLVVETASNVTEAKQRSQGLRGAEALMFLWQDFLLPLGRSMVPGVEAAVAAFGPDVMIVDQQAIEIA